MYADVRDLLVKHDPDTSEPILSCPDKNFNMVSLNRQLHWYWDRAFYGLKPVDEGIPRFDGYVELIRVEWRWLPRRFAQALVNSNHVLPTADRNHLRQVNLESVGLADFAKHALEDIDEALDDDVPQGTPLGQLPSGRRIESGLRFDLRASKDDAANMRALLKLQWLAVRMARISGAADVVDDLWGERRRTE